MALAGWLGGALVCCSGRTKDSRAQSVAIAAFNDLTGSDQMLPALISGKTMALPQIDLGLCAAARRMHP